MPEPLGPVTTVTITVSPVNDAPVVATPLSDQAFDEDTAVNFTVPAGAFTDIDSANLTYSATLESGAALPSWLSFDPATRAFSGTPPLNFNGAFDIRVTASDGALSASDVFTLTIRPVNDAPDVQGESGTLAEDNAILYTQAELLANDSDVDNTLSVASFTIAGMTGTQSTGTAVTVTDGNGPVGSLTLNANEKQQFLVPYAARGERDPIMIWLKTCCNIQIGTPVLFVVGRRGCTCVH